MESASQDPDHAKIEGETSDEPKHPDSNDAILDNLDTAWEYFDRKQYDRMLAQSFDLGGRS